MSKRATSVAAAVLAKVPMMALVGDPAPAAKVESAVRELVESQIGFIRIGNPLVAPLSLERVVLQITKDEADDVPRDDAERVLRALIARSDMRRQLVVLVEQAETLTPDALEFLHGMPELSHPSLAPVQVALVGTAALGTTIAGDNRIYVIGNPAAAAPATAAPTPVEAPPSTRPQTVQKRRSRSELLVLSGLGVCAAAAIVFMLYDPFQSEAVPHGPTPLPNVADLPPSAAAVPLAVPVAPVLPPATQQLADTLPSPAQAPQQVAPAELPAPEPPVPPVTPPLADPAIVRGRLYREFAAFLDTQSVGRRLSSSEREALLQEYLARNHAPPPSVPTETSRIPGNPRVLLFFAADSDLDHVAAEHEAELLRDRVSGVDVQPSTAVPTVPTIRYAFPADRPAALALAQTTPAPGGEWQIEEIGASPERPGPGTIEMWLPRR